jgi:hypothetical protein
MTDLAALTRHRRPLPARLELRLRPGARTRRDPNYYWYIVDGADEHSTRCPHNEQESAEAKLQHRSLLKTVSTLKQAQMERHD